MKSLNNKRLRKAYLIAELLTQQVQLTAAEKMYMLTLARHEKALGADHMLTLLTVNNLGNLYANQGKLDEAEKMYQRALAGYEQALGPDHTSTLDAVNNFGNLYTHQGKLDEAEKMYQRALTGSAGIQIDHVARRERGMTGCVAGSGYGIWVQDTVPRNDVDSMTCQLVPWSRRALHRSRLPTQTERPDCH